MDHQLNQQFNNTTDQRRKEILRRLQQRRDDENKGLNLTSSVNCDYCQLPCLFDNECMCGHRSCSKACANKLHENLKIFNPTINPNRM